MILLEKILVIARTGMCNTEIKKVTKEETTNLFGKELEILHKIIIAPHVSLALMVLQESGFFDYLIPEIKESIELRSSKHFKEIWPHTLNVINKTPAKLSLRWAALFHDLGKAKTFSIKDGIVTFHNHEKISAKIFDTFAKRSRIFTTGQHKCIRFLISNLGYAEGYESNWTESAVRRFAREMDIYLEDLLTLSEADITTGNTKKHDKILRKIQELKNRIIEIREKDMNTKSLLPKGIGNEIAEKLGIKYGPEIGAFRTKLEDKIKKGELLANENFEYYIEFLKNDIIP